MQYLKQPHTQLLFITFFISSIIFVSFPDIDIQVSSLFFDNGFYLRNIWWERVLYKSVTPFLIIALIAIISLWLINKYKDKNIFSIDGKKTAFFVLVLVLGSGLIVHAVLKDNFGRARPRNIVEFDGPLQYTPAFVVSQNCDKSCSFSSGHGSAAFASLALALFFRHRKTALTIAFIYGSSVSFARIVAGGHFLSDNVVSFFIMAITTDVLYYLFFLRKKTADG